MKLHKYLIEFEEDLHHGSIIGVTAHSEEDETNIVFEELFHSQKT